MGITNNNTNTHRTTSRLFNYLSATFALLIWGGWAYYINYSFGQWARVIAAITQGLASFFITLFLVRIVTFLYFQLPDNNSQLVVPAIVAVSGTSSLLVLFHLISGTQEILFTILPTSIVAFLFCLYTCVKIKQSIQLEN
jgi:hypothetical protein